MNLTKNKINLKFLKFIPCVIMPIIVIINIILFYNSLFISAGEAFDMIYKTVICIIFPYMITAEILGKLPVHKLIPKSFEKVYQKIFGVSKNTAPAYIMGNICGYPVGAKMLFSAYEQKSISKSELEKTLPYVTNSSIGFATGTIGTVLLENTFAGFVIYVIQILSTFICALLSKKAEIYKLNFKSDTPSINLGKIISNATQNTVLIAGTVLCFNLFITMAVNIFSLANLSGDIQSFIKLILASVLEITNGVICAKNTLSGFWLFMVLNIINCFSGISVAMQIKMISPDIKFSIKPYFYVKIKQSAVACILSFIVYLLPI